MDLHLRKYTCEGERLDGVEREGIREVVVASAGPMGSSSGVRPSPPVAQGGRVWACGLSAGCHPWMDDAWRGSLRSGWVQSWVRATPWGASVSAANTPGGWDGSCPALQGALGATWHPLDPAAHGCTLLV